MNKLNDLKLGVKLGLGFGVILILVISVSSISYLSVDSLVKTSDKVNHTNELIHVVDAASASMVDMETGLRGFLVTGEEKFLAPYYAGLGRFHGLIKQGLTFTKDDSVQTERLLKLDNMEDQWLTKWAEPIIKKRSLVSEGVESLAHFREVSSRTLGKTLFDAIRNKLTQLDSKVPARNLKAKHLVTKATLALVNMETGQRGFLLSGDESSLEPYVQGETALIKTLNQLIRVAGNVSYEVEIVKKAVFEWQSKVANLEIEARREMNKHQVTIDDLVADMATGIGKQYMDEIRSEVERIIEAEERVITAQVDAQKETANFASEFTLQATLVIALVSLIVAWSVTRSIVRPMKELRDVVNEVSKSGDLSKTAKCESQDEVGETILAFNQLLSHMKSSIDEVSGVAADIAEGKFDSHVTSDFNGDFDLLKRRVNDSTMSVKTTMGELCRIMHALEEGDFSVRVEGDSKGEFRRVVDSAMSSLNGAISDITRILVAQSEGDLTQTITADYSGELKVLKNAVNSTGDKLIAVVSEAVNSSEIVSEAASEVYHGAVSLSQRVQEQASALEETSATMDEMNSAVQANTENSKEASDVAIDVQSKATKGTEVMKETIDAMNSIQESSLKIADIVALIDGIAFQTNLLALNAAVEAARAGEHGRGFAVVAGEVRSLAQKSAEAAKDIKQLIEESVSRIDNGTDLAAKSGDMLETISSSVETVTKMVSQIAQASSEQSVGIGQVHSAITQIDEATQENASLVDQTKAASASMTEQSDELIRNMSFFNIGHSEHHSDRHSQQKAEHTSSSDDNEVISALPMPTPDSLEESESPSEVGENSGDSEKT